MDSGNMTSETIVQECTRAAPRRCVIDVRKRSRDNVAHLIADCGRPACRRGYTRSCTRPSRPRPKYRLISRLSQRRMPKVAIDATVTFIP